MVGKPCIRGMRVSVAMIVGMIRMGHTADKLVADYPYLVREDILQALQYAALSDREHEIKFFGL